MGVKYGDAVGNVGIPSPKMAGLLGSTRAAIGIGFESPSALMVSRVVMSTIFGVGGNMRSGSDRELFNAAIDNFGGFGLRSATWGRVGVLVSMVCTRSTGEKGVELEGNTDPSGWNESIRR